MHLDERLAQRSGRLRLQDQPQDPVPHGLPMRLGVLHPRQDDEPGGRGRCQARRAVRDRLCLSHIEAEEHERGRRVEVRRAQR